MTQEDRQLLLVDLSARLPYGVKGAYLNDDGSIPNDRLLSKITITYTSLVTAGHRDGMVLTGDIKPYLFPLSSITDEQYENFLLTNSEITLDGVICSTKGFEFLNANHFDFRGLIKKGLAIDATGLNIY